MREKHTLTFDVSNETWKIFKMICDTDNRRVGNQIARFLELMSGVTNQSTIRGSNFPEIETKLYRAFSSLQKIDQNRKRAKIIPFPIMLKGCG